MCPNRKQREGVQSSSSILDYGRVPEKPRSLWPLGLYSCIGLLAGFLILVVCLGVRIRYDIMWLGPFMFPWTSFVILTPILHRNTFGDATVMFIWAMGPLEYAGYGILYAIISRWISKKKVIAGLVSLHLVIACVAMILMYGTSKGDTRNGDEWTRKSLNE